MTREDAIKWVKFVHDVLYEDKDEDIRTALNMAISALSADTVSREDYHNLLMASKDIDRALREYQAKDENPSADRPTDGDLISRADAMGAVQDHFNADGFKGYDDGQKMMDRIKTLPSVSAEPKRGEWIEAQIDTAEFPVNFLECTACGYRIGRETYLENTFTYCPNCGAYMGKGESDD